MSKPKTHPLAGAEDIKTQGQDNAPDVTTESASVEQPDTSNSADTTGAPHTSDDAPSAEANTSETQDLLTCPHNLHKLGKELVTVTQELTVVVQT